MPDKRSLIGLRQRASELADTGRLNSWHEIGVALEAEGYPLALLRMDLDTCLRQSLRARFGQTRVTTGVRHALQDVALMGLPHCTPTSVSGDVA
jgi:hypothetical protein